MHYKPGMYLAVRIAVASHRGLDQLHLSLGLLSLHLSQAFSLEAAGVSL